MEAQGTVELVGVNGVTLSGNAHVRVNTSGASVDQAISIPNTPDEVEINFATGDRVTEF